MDDIINVSLLRTMATELKVGTSLIGFHSFSVHTMFKIPCLVLCVAKRFSQSGQVLFEIIAHFPFEYGHKI